MRRSSVPLAEAVKTVSSPNVPPARANRIVPFNAVVGIDCDGDGDVIDSDGEAGTDADADRDARVGERPPLDAHDDISRTTTVAAASVLAARSHGAPGAVTGPGARRWN